MCKYVSTLLATAVLGGAATAHADLTWAWAFTGLFAFRGGAVSGEGTLTTGPLNGGAYPVTSIDGALAGSSVSGLSVDYAYYGVPDNTLYTPGNNGLDSLQLSAAGLSFSLNSGDVINLFDQAGYAASDQNDQFLEVGNFIATEIPTAAPEPSQIVSLLSLAGVGGAGLLLQRCRRK